MDINLQTRAASNLDGEFRKYQSSKLFWQENEIEVFDA
jgi:hypothetical protein